MDKGADKCAARGFEEGMLYGEVAILLRAGAASGRPGQGNADVVPSTCPNCGYVMLFETIALRTLRTRSEGWLSFARGEVPKGEVMNREQAAFESLAGKLLHAKEQAERLGLSPSVVEAIDYAADLVDMEWEVTLGLPESSDQ
jgi:hypothetical protein